MPTNTPALETAEQIVRAELARLQIDLDDNEIDFLVQTYLRQRATLSRWEHEQIILETSEPALGLIL